MYSLLLDSSSSFLTVGFSKENELVCSTSYEAWQTQSEYMIPEIDKLMKKYSISRNEIDSIIVSIGPGSYTGVRIALTIAKVSALALNVPVYPVSSLRVLKSNDLPSICLINARSERSYFGVFKGDEIIVDDCIKSNDEVKDYINKHPDYIICGDARYLGFDNVDNNICKQMISLKPFLKPMDDSLGLKPIYMKD
ncbi:MAG: tRNA (adenosine(37)-N6)-threonylcarbamoyltransferase complex dimerization subunit type 1 TsaB [Bacilli bacterium]|nr:tRNA (adenosine(37)-N6)-threonylcarbamoyltransferase complex dimerization subunit type 1 TsaB [Bacilli bacterium]